MTTRQLFEITYRDKFDSKKNYNKLDIIKFMGEFYVCTKDGTVGINPSNSECFDKLEFFDEQESKTTQEKQAESEKYEKTFDAGYENGYAQARFDYEQDPCEVVLNKIRAEVESINVWALRYAPSKDKDMRPQIVTNVKNHVLEIIDKYRIK